MNETLFSWIELELLLRRLEKKRLYGSSVTLKRRSIQDNKERDRVSVRSHFRYGDRTVLNAYVGTEVQV